MRLPLRLVGFMLLTLFLGACNLLNNGDVPTPTSSSDNQRPVVTIISPANGAEIAVNVKADISVVAADTTGVTRVQLFVNGQVVKTVSSQTAGGDVTFSTLLDYTPPTLGTIQVQVYAFRGSISSDPTTLSLTVVQPPTSTRLPTTAPIIITSPPVVNPFDPTCRLLVNTSLNLRTGPGINYDRILTLNANTVVPITGRLGDNSWWQVRVGTTTGWVSNQFITLYGNCSGVIIPPIPPTPTPRVGATVTPSVTVAAPTAVPPTQTPTSLPLPDLVITTFNGSETLVLGAGGTPVTSLYTVVITNTGGGMAAQFNNIVNISPPSTDYQLGVVGNLSASQSVTLTINLTFSAAGTYTLQARADNLSQVTEISEVNNLGLFTVTVTNPP